MNRLEPVAQSPVGWAAGLFGAPLAPTATAGVWAMVGETPEATISDQFKAEAEAYHRLYGASEHFEALFRNALDASGVTVAERPLILDLGSGSGVNSVLPCLKIFPGARIVATDLSHELLGILARRANLDGRVACVAMDAGSRQVAHGRFDLVTGAAILHHLTHPNIGLKAAARALKPGGHAVFMEPFEGYGLIRLAYEAICREADLRGEVLAPEIRAALEAIVADIAIRTHPDPTQPHFADLDDKWLFSREIMDRMARNAGFAEVRFVPHNDHPTLYRDVAAIQLRLTTGRSDLALPDWALDVLDRFDRAIPQPTKRLMMLEASIVLTRGDQAEPGGAVR